MFEEGNVEDSRGPIPYREQRKGCGGKPPAAIQFNQYNCMPMMPNGGGWGEFTLASEMSAQLLPQLPHLHESLSPPFLHFGQSRRPVPDRSFSAPTTERQ